MNIKNISILLLLLVTVINNSFAKENKILVKVNNEIITTVDVLNEIKFLSFTNIAFKKIEKQQQIQIAKDSLIKEKIKLIELIKFKKNLNLEDEIFEEVAKNYFIDQNIQNWNEYSVFLKKNNLDIQFIKEKISIDTFWKGLIYEKFHKNVKIDINQVKKDILIKEKQNEYFLSEIVFSLNKDERLNQKLKKITDLIKNKNFAEAAFNFSISDTTKNGGKLGWIKENVLNSKIKKELKNMDIGEYTNPIVIPGGFLILKIEDIREIKRDLDIEKETKKVINKKTNNQLNRLSNIYLNKLRLNIQINEI